jgi:hypothetical protein
MNVALLNTLVDEADVVSLAHLDVDAVTSDLDNSDSVLGVLCELSIGQIGSSILLAYESGGSKVSIAVEF